MSRPGTEESKRIHDLVGRRLMGRYAVRQRIARGGMAVVFRGEDERLRRPVCVKLFFGFNPEQPEYAVVLEHFVQEAFALSRLQHPSTLRIYDFGYLDEEARIDPFFVTEFADGGHLGELVAGSGGLSGAEVLRRLGPIIGALREAHSAGIVHRDLKPSNILLTSAGGELQPKLADFSIAKAHGDLPNRASETNAQAPLYSLSWAAPEQLAGTPVTPAADVFALGLLAAYMLTEKLVYPGDDVMALYSLRSEGAPFREQSIRGLGLPPAVERVVLRACAEAPERRHPSVDAFYDALEAALGVYSGEIDDDETTGEHRALERPPLERPPLERPPLERPMVRRENTLTAPESVGAKSGPHLLPPVSPPDPAQAPPAKPRLPVATLAEAQLLVGNRRMRLLAASAAPLTLERAIAGRPAKLRVTPRELGAGQVHLKGLNCFLRTLDGRPSSGLDVDHPRILELSDPQSRTKGELRISMGRRPDGHHEIELGDVIVTVPAQLARWAVVLEAGDDTLLLYLPPHQAQIPS
ncbi:MAG: serine/threonine protein kinase [Myxococcales bacterium]|nr:serine/threonine protein kinase [Myxococcales bacterium]